MSTRSRKLRKVISSGIALLFAALCLSAFWIGLGDRLDSPVDEQRPWGVDDWNESINPQLLSGRPSWPATGIRELEELDRGRDFYKLFHAPLVTDEGDDFVVWESKVDAVREGDVKVSLEGVRSIRGSRFALQCHTSLALKTTKKRRRCESI